MERLVTEKSKRGAYEECERKGMRIRFRGGGEEATLQALDVQSKVLRRAMVPTDAFSVPDVASKVWDREGDATRG